MKSVNLIRRVSLIAALLVLSLIYSAVVSSIMVSADELDGYTVVDWSWNRDIETTDNNSVLMGQDFLFWRYVNKNNPTSGAIWKSAYGDELTDEEISLIWENKKKDKYFRITIDADSIPDESIRNYIYTHVDEWVPDLRMKFDIDADIKGKNADKADKLFNGNIGYRVFRDSDGICKLEIKFSPQFHVLKAKDVYDTDKMLPNMPNKILPRAQYPFSSALFSMWGISAGSNEHYGSLEVIEGDDPRYIYGQSFGYGDILEKGRIPENMVYQNFEAGKINEEGTTVGQREDDTLDSNLIRIGQQYKRSGDLWYYSYGGAVGYLFKFPVRVTFELNEQAHITKRFIDTSTGEVITSELITMPFEDKDTLTADFALADRTGTAIIEGVEDRYIYQRYDIKTPDDEVIGNGSSANVTIEVNRTVKDKILDIYVTKLPIASRLIIKYIDTSTGEEIKSEERIGPTLTKPDDENVIDYHIEPIDNKPIKKYVISLPDDSIEDEVNNPVNLDVRIPVTAVKPTKIITIHCGDRTGRNDSDDNGRNDNADEPATLPLDPPICNSKTNTITWTETVSHTVYDGEGYSHTCIHKYNYRANLSVDSITISPEILKSGYGMDVSVSTSVSYAQTGQSRTSAYCSWGLSGSRTPQNKPTPPTKVAARLGWKTNTFDGIYIQGSIVQLKRVSNSGTRATFSAPHNDAVGEDKIYTDLYLSGTGDVPRKHKIAFDIYGGGVNSTQWCTTAEKLITINGDMYEDGGTTST